MKELLTPVIWMPYSFPAETHYGVLIGLKDLPISKPSTANEVRSLWETLWNYSSIVSIVYRNDLICSLHCINDYYYDVQLPINHVISKTVLHLVAVCITSQKHSKYMLKVCRKFSKKKLTFKLLFLIFVIKVENNHKKFYSKTFES